MIENVSVFKDILSVLREIYGVLSFILYLYIALLLIKVIRFFISLRKQAAASAASLEATIFAKNMERLFVADKMPELLKEAEEKLMREANNTTALYWMMRSYYKMGNSQRTKDTYLRLGNIDPSVRDTYRIFIENMQS